MIEGEVLDKVMIVGEGARHMVIESRAVVLIGLVDLSCTEFVIEDDISDIYLAVLLIVPNALDVCPFPECGIGAVLFPDKNSGLYTLSEGGVGNTRLYICRTAEYFAFISERSMIGVTTADSAFSAASAATSR